MADLRDFGYALRARVGDQGYWIAETRVDEGVAVLNWGLFEPITGTGVLLGIVRADLKDGGLLAEAGIAQLERQFGG
jgi:hypothetical protein